MKKFALVALLVAVAFGSAFAAASPSPSGAVKISGSIAESFSLSLPREYQNGVINNDADTVWQIGDVKVVSNLKNWTLKLESANAGKLVNTAEGNEKIAYKVTLGTLFTAVDLSSAKTSAAQGRTAKAGNTYAMAVKVLSSADFYQAGTYTDTITVTLVHP
ncbi:MAG: hypothetical protein ABFC65_05150 [Rectinema sp.]